MLAFQDVDACSSVAACHCCSSALNGVGMVLEELAAQEGSSGNTSAFLLRVRPFLLEAQCAYLKSIVAMQRADMTCRFKNYIQSTYALKAQAGLASVVTKLAMEDSSKVKHALDAHANAVNLASTIHGPLSIQTYQCQKSMMQADRQLRERHDASTSSRSSSGKNSSSRSSSGIRSSGKDNGITTGGGGGSAAGSGSGSGSGSMPTDANTSINVPVIAGDAGGGIILDSDVEHGKPGASNDSSDCIPQQPATGAVEVSDSAVTSPPSAKDPAMAATVAAATSAGREGRQQQPSHACACCHKAAVAGKKLQKCAGCKAVRYCSSECQAQHWKTGGHRQQCKRLAAIAAGSGGGGGA
jgi:hypothetical protein